MCVYKHASDAMHTHTKCKAVMQMSDAFKLYNVPSFNVIPLMDSWWGWVAKKCSNLPAKGEKEDYLLM